ncbi:MAG: hypothetical protein MI919_31875, partial [Holophagales bacterium]|nr:hypothetical protein [Holophagales bacterium]
SAIADVLPSASTGQKVPCAEDPTRMCDVVARSSDWEADARTERLGVLARPKRADQRFAEELSEHLAQRINNSMFVLAFRAAQGVFEQHVEAGRDLPRTVIWLSDGRSDEPERVVLVLRELEKMDVGVEAIVFGRGETALAEQAGLEARRAAGPAELMKAFAGAFRRIVEAPYEIDAPIAERPTFPVQPAVEEAWVVVYGGDGLGEVYLEMPDGERRPADHASRVLEGAGAYRVAHFLDPPAGQYRVSARGGSEGAAYAVVQRSSLRPRLVQPEEALAEAETRLVVEVVAGEAGTPVRDQALLAGASVSVSGGELGAVELERRDDGRFEGVGRFRRSGEAVLTLALTSPVVESRVETKLVVSGFFRPRRNEVEIELGRLGVGEQSCRAVELEADHQGEVPLRAEGLRRRPAEHELVLRIADRDEDWRLDGEGRLSPEDRLEVCLRVGARAPSSSSEGLPWIRLGVPGAEETVSLLLAWQVDGLGFWARWGWLVLTVLGVLLLIFVITGFVLPHRFSPSLSLVFVDEREELDEQQPQPLAQWKGVGIGFYRHARAHLQTSFRVSGKSRGALATLQAERRGARVLPGKGAALSRETLDGDWETVAAEGRKVRGGDTYRIGEGGPYFRVAVRGGRDG